MVLKELEQFLFAPVFVSLASVCYESVLWERTSTILPDLDTTLRTCEMFSHPEFDYA